MSDLALIASGWLAGVLTVVGCAIIALRWSGDRTNDARDQEAEPLFVGGGEVLNHLASTNAAEQHDHA